MAVSPACVFRRVRIIANGSTVLEDIEDYGRVFQAPSAPLPSQRCYSDVAKHLWILALVSCVMTLSTARVERTVLAVTEGETAAPSSSVWAAAGASPRVRRGESEYDKAARVKAASGVRAERDERVMVAYAPPWNSKACAGA